MVPSWLRQLFKKRFVGQGATRPIRTHLDIESLEDRSLPAVDVWTGNSIAIAQTLVIVNTGVTPNTTRHTSLWSDGGNWSLGRAPLPGDDVVFPVLDAAHKPRASIIPPLSWPNNSEIDRDFQINSLTILDDNYHIDAFPGDSFGNAAFNPPVGQLVAPNAAAHPTLTITGQIHSNIPQALGTLSGLSVLGSLTRDTSNLTIVMTGVAQQLFAENVGILKISAPIIDPPAGSTFFNPGLHVGLSKIGTGTMVLSGSNSFTGVVNVQEGTLLISNFNGLGSSVAGTTVQPGATLSITGAGGIRDSLSINGDGLNGIGALNGGADPLGVFDNGQGPSDTGGSTWSGNINLAASSTIGTIGSSITVSGQITGGGDLTKTGGATLTLTNKNAYSGQTLINQGVVQIQDNDALSSTPLSSTTVASGATLRILGDLTVPETLFLNGDGQGTDGNGNPFGALVLGTAGSHAVWAGSITLLSNASIGVVNSNTPGFNTTLLTVTGQLGGAFDLSKVDQGTLRFPTANLGFTGNTFVRNGIVQIADPNALGDPTGGVIGVTNTNNTQGSLNVEGNYTIGKALSLAGPGFNSLGALHIFENPTGLASSITWGGPITLADRTSIRIDPVSTLNIAGGMDGSTAATLDRFGLGTLRLTSNNTYQGATLLREGLTTLEAPAGLGAGSFGVGTLGTQVSTGATLAIATPQTVDGEDLILSGTGINGRGVLLAPAGTTTWTGLVVLNGINTTEADINVAPGGVLNFSGVLSGDADLRKLGAGELDLTGDQPNQFVKTTFLDQGTIALGKSVGQALGGTIIVGDGLGGNNVDVLRLDASNQIPFALSLLIRESGLFDLNNKQQTLGGVTAVNLSGGEINTGPTGLLTLGGNLTTNGSSEVSVITGTVDLGGTTRTFSFAATPAVTLSTNRNAATASTDVTFTFTALANPGVATPTGTVKFFDNGQLITTATNTSGVFNLGIGTGSASVTTRSLTVGSHVITAQYSGDANYPPVSVVLAPNQVIVDPPVQTLLSTNLNPGDPDKQITFSYQIKAAPGNVTPTGTVSFFDNGALITTLTNPTGVFTLDAVGRAAITTLLLRGVHDITAVYSGDAIYSPSTTSLAPSLSVGTVPVVTVTSGGEPALRGQSVTYTFRASGAGGNGIPTGTVSFFDTFTDHSGNVTTTAIAGSDVTPITLNAQGFATISATFNTVGQHFITAVYHGDTIYTPLTASLNPTQLVVNPLVGSISVNTNPITVNRNVTYTVVFNGRPGQPVPTGQVTLRDVASGSAVGAGFLNGAGVAVIQVGAGIQARALNVTADFTTLDDNYLTQTDVVPPVSVQVTTGTGTPANAFQFYSNNDRALPNTPIQFSVESTTAQGQIQFAINGSPIGGPINLNGGIGAPFVFSPARITIPGLVPGTYTITAAYVQTPGNTVANQTITMVLGQFVVAPITAALQSSSNPVQANVPFNLTFTTAVAAGAQVPTGTVQFLDNGLPIGVGTLNGAGVATLTNVTLGAGTHNITANYGGDAFYIGGFLATLNPAQVVTGGNPSQTVLTSSANSAAPGTTITFTYTAVPSSGQQPPTGLVTFRDNGVAIGVPQNLFAGVATISTSSLSVGVHNITADYGGDSNYVASTATLSPQQRIVNVPLAVLASDAPINPANGAPTQQNTQQVTFTLNMKTNVIPNVTTPLATGAVRFFFAPIVGGVAGTPVQLGVDTALNVDPADPTNAFASVTAPGGFFTAGSYRITVMYLGDTNYQPLALTLQPDLVITNTPAPPLAPGLTTKPSQSPVLQVNGVITGVAAPGFQAPGIVKSGVGNMVLNGNSTYTGSTTINGTGALTIGVDNALPTGTDLTINGGTVDINGKQQTLASLNGATPVGRLLLGGPTAVLTTGGGSYSGTIEGAGTLKKVGPATLSLLGASPLFSGKVDVTGGALSVGTANGVGGNLSHPLEQTILRPGTSLIGTGAVAGAGNVQSNGGSTFSPGTAGVASGAGTLRVATASLLTGDLFAVNIAGTGAGQFDQIVATGTVTLNGATLALNLGTFIPTVGSTFTIVTATTLTVTNPFKGTAGTVLANNATFVTAGRVFRINYTGTAVTLTVVALADTAQLTASANPSDPGAAVTFTASITRALGTDPTPTGTVDFYFDSVTPANKIGATKTLSGVTGTGTATSDPISTLTIGTHTIIAVYTSTNSFQDSTTGLSLTLTQTVNYPTTTVVTASSGRTYFGEPVIYTATVSGPGGTPTGTVNFFTGTGVFLGAGTLSGGVAQISTGAVPPGVNTIQAVYVGDATHRTSSGVTTEVVDRVPLYAVGSAVGGLGVVTAYNQSGQVAAVLQPYGAYAGGVKVAVGDVNGDGISDLITMAGPGALNGLIEIFNGRDLSLLGAYFGFFAGYPFELNITAGDVNGDGRDDVVLGTASYVNVVLVYDGGTPNLMAIYYAPLFDKLGYSGGITVAAGDIDGDGKAEVITGAVSQFSLATIAGGMTGQLLGAFFLGTPGGVNVATGDLNGDRRSEIILGTATGAAQVNVYDGASFGLLASFNSIGFPTGVTVAAVDRDGDHKDDLLVGAATTVPFAEIFSGISLSPLDIIYLPGSGPTSGLNVAGN